ncbi:MAG: CXXX repeat peptide modification system protein [Bacteroidaceae bacterium]|nr:CXXX repeat peptide modification system protein [Bacteroidaceae bacterium]
MVKKLVGQVTPEEKQEILTLFERRNGLNELAKIVTADNDALYQKLVTDMGETGTKFQSWWDRMAQKYRWGMHENGNWEINFDTCEIFLVMPGDEEGGAS